MSRSRRMVMRTFSGGSGIIGPRLPLLRSYSRFIGVAFCAGGSDSELLELGRFQRHNETCSCSNFLGLIDNRRPPFDETPGLIPKLDRRPAFGEKERGQSRVQPRFALELVLRNTNVPRNDHPIAFGGQCSYPVHI